MIAPNMTIATPKAETRLRLIARLAKRRSGSTGSAALRSMRTKAVRATTLRAKRPIDSPDPQAQLEPPKETASSSATRPVESVVMPR